MRLGTRVIPQEHHEEGPTSPMRSRIAGDGIRNPRCRVKKLTAWPGTCRVGIQPLR